MQIFVFSITYNDGNMSMSQVYGKSIMSAMFDLVLISGCCDACIDYIGKESTCLPLDWDDCDTAFLSSIN